MVDELKVKDGCTGKADEPRQEASHAETDRVELGRIAIEVLQRIRKEMPTPELLKEVVTLLAYRIGFDAVGLRLKEGDDYPYFQTRGMSGEFIRLENSLCPRRHAGLTGLAVRDNVPLECVCGAVVQSRINPSLPCFSEYGSFWTNSNTQLLIDYPEFREIIRGNCVQAGYETSALIPLRLGSDTFGLLQFEAMRPGMLSQELLTTLESIAVSLALVLSQRQYAEELRKEKEALERRVHERNRDLCASTEALRQEIEERKRAEEALKESEGKYRALFEHAGDAIFIHDPEAQILAANPMACERLGYTSSELMSLTVAQVDSPHEASHVADRIALLLDQDHLSFETVHRRKDGAFIPTEVNARMITWEGKPATMSICRDISERKKAEAALTHSYKLMRYIIEHNRSAIAVLDRDLRYVYVSQRFLDDHGAKDLNVIGMHHYDLLADMPQKWKEVHRRALSGETSSAENDPYVREDGTVEWTRWECRPWYEADGSIGGIILYTELITDRKRAEEALQESEALISESQKIAHLGSWSLDAATNRLTWTDEVYRIFGLEPKEFDPTYESFLEGIHPEDREAVNTAYSNSVRKRQDAYEIEHRIVRKHTGEVRHVHEKCVHVRDAAGTIIRSIGMVQDITERKRAEGEAYTQKETLEKVFESAPYIMMLVNREGRVTKINRTGAAFSGRPKEELLGLLGGEVFNCLNSFRGSGCGKNPECGDCPVRSRVMRTLQTKESIHDVEGSMMIRRGQKDIAVDMLISASIVSDRDSEQVLVTIADITGRKEAERALAHSHDLMRYIIEHNRSAIAVHDRELRYIYVSQRYLQDYSVKEQDVIGKHHYDVFPDLPQKWRDVHQRALTGEISSAEDDPYFREDGAVDWTRWECRPWYESDGSIGGIIVYTEVTTERKRAEEERERLQAQLTQAQKMESVGRLAGGVAHDFNNMLSVILGHTEMAMEQVDLAQPLFADLMEIDRAARRSTDLTRQLLAFARRQTIAPKVLDLNETVESMLKMLRRLIGEDIDLAWLPHTNLWPVKVDPSQIDQILANLCVNARDAIAGVGKITIETKAVTFDQDYCANHSGFIPGEFVLLAVSDDGCGMDKETLRQVFEPFFTTKDLGKGTGLGLATVYGIVKQNNGFINVYSEPDNGTTFRIYLPRYAAKTKPVHNKAPKPSARGGSETILLVEDEPSILNMTKRMLERIGYTVLAAGTPGEAIRIAEGNAGEIHLLMTDVVMPEMNGRDLAMHLLSLCPNLRRLFMSGYTTNVIAHHGVLEEGVNFIQKPFSMQDLATKLREALEQEDG